MVFHISGVVDVSMYQSVLCPDFTLGRDGEVDEKTWALFDVKKYKALVCERAVLELKKLFEQLPVEKRCAYVERSADIHSAYMHNILDRLYFAVRMNNTDRDEAQMQVFLRDFFLADWNTEFGASYRISEFISSNYGVGDFPLDSDDGEIPF